MTDGKSPTFVVPLTLFAIAFFILYIIARINHPENFKSNTYEKGTREQIRDIYGHE